MHFNKEVEHSATDIVQIEPIPTASVSLHDDGLEVEPPNLDDWQNEEEMASENEIIPPGHGENENSNVIVEEAVDRMRLRQREPAPIPVVSINLSTFIRTNIYSLIVLITSTLIHCQFS